MKIDCEKSDSCVSPRKNNKDAKMEGISHSLPSSESEDTVLQLNVNVGRECEKEWSPWNCVLLSREECRIHVKLGGLHR